MISQLEDPEAPETEGGDDEGEEDTLAEIQERCRLIREAWRREYEERESHYPLFKWQNTVLHKGLPVVEFKLKRRVVDCHSLGPRLYDIWRAKMVWENIQGPHYTYQHKCCCCGKRLFIYYAEAWHEMGHPDEDFNGGRELPNHQWVCFDCEFYYPEANCAEFAERWMAVLNKSQAEFMECDINTAYAADMARFMYRLYKATTESFVYEWFMHHITAIANDINSVPPPQYQRFIQKNHRSVQPLSRKKLVAY